MRLAELEPRWLLDGVRRVGIAFLCPCAKCKGAGVTIAVRFANPIGGGPATPNREELIGNNNGHRWSAAGSELEDLTITPSIDCTKDLKGLTLPEAQQHWHGFVTLGECGPG